MSAFEVVITPPRLKNAKKSKATKEPTEVVLSPFSSKPIVIFDDVPVSKTARRLLIFINPTRETLTVSILKMLKPEYNVTFEWMSREVPADGKTSLELVWIPDKALSNTETIQFIDNRNMKKDVMFIFKSIKSKNTDSKPKSATVTKKLKMKCPSSPKRYMKLHKALTIKSVTETITEEPYEKPLGATFSVQVKDMPSSTSFNFSAILSPRNTNKEKPINTETFQSPPSVRGKENNTPEIHKNVSSIFDDFNFTPLNQEKKDTIDYLASLQTPTINSTDTGRKIENNLKINELNIPLIIEPMDDGVKSIRKSIQYSPVSTSTESKLCDMITPKCFEIKESSMPFCSTARPARKSRSLADIMESEVIRIDSKAPLSDKTYQILDYVPSHGNISLKSPVEINKTVNVDHLTAEPKETMTHDQSNILQKTYDIAPAVEDNVTKERRVGTPLMKKFQSMKDLNQNLDAQQQQLLKCMQGSMPNLRDCDQIDPLESNRYFNQYVGDCYKEPGINASSLSIVSVASGQEVMFNKNEIKAQSSRFNINEIGVAINESNLSQSSFCFDNANGASSQKDVYFAIPRSAVKRVGFAAPNRSTLKISPNRQKYSRQSISNVSLQKRSRNDSDTDDSGRSTASSTSLRTSTWGGVKPKKIPKMTTQLILKKQEEQRVILFDPDLHIQSVINPDPFAATTTSDPFLASTMYLDEQSIDKNEINFLKWLNALVRIPADLEVSPKKIDFGRLFNDVKDQNLTIAESKETVSSNYLTNHRMDSLRKLAIKLYVGDEIRKPFEKLAVHIEKKLIGMRADRQLHLDIVLQKEVLELLMCFSPLWLRIGLEVIYGEQIYMQHNSDTLSLSVFIINRMFKDKYLEEKYSKSYVRSAAYQEHIKKFTLRKFLMLIFFLDKAKSKKIIVHNPCLFLKSAPYKETKDILLKFSSLLLGNIGDVQRDLKRIGIVMVHKQTFLDEFDYAFRNLAIDLRDGVRITKVMEIILLRDDLTNRLRVPAISRLQKIYNVNVALQALKDAEFTLTGEITASSVADGHREKTLSLLWQLIYKFRSPMFNAAAVTIQKWWRKSWLRVNINRRIAEKIKKRRIAAATKIQSVFRGYITKKYYKIYREKLVLAAIILQSNWKRFIARRRFKRTYNAIKFVQSVRRGLIETRKVRQRYVDMKLAAIRIQNWYRRIVLVRKIEQIVPFMRNIIETSIRQKQSLVLIQNKLRATLLMKKQRKEFLRIKEAATVIQLRLKATLIMIKTRKNYLKLKSWTTIIQQRFRAKIEMHRQRELFLKKKSAVILLQNYFRSYQITKSCRMKFIQLKAAAIILQRHYRAKLLMKQERKSFLQLKMATVAIQRRFKARNLMIIARTEYLKRRSACITIQSRFTATLLMKKQRKEYLQQVNSALVIQRRFRAKKSMELCVNNYKKLQKASITIQSIFRAKQLMRQKRNEYLMIKSATVCIQRQYRALISMRSDKKNFVEKRKACVQIQQWYRAYIQGRSDKKSFSKLKQAAILIQRRFHANKAMINDRKQYLELYSRVLFIQRFYKNKLEMRKVRCSYMHTVKCIISVQRLYRAKKLMLSARNDYAAVRQSTIKIQNWYRATYLMKAERNYYLELRSRTIIIQQHLRSTLLMRQIKAEYNLWKNSAIKIQRFFRGWLLMKKHQNDFVQLKNAVILSQTKFRANRLMQKQKTKFNSLKNTAIVIQRHFKALKLMRIERSKYLLLRHVTINCQQRYRANVQMMYEHSAYLQLKQSVIFIQRLFRGKLFTREIRQKFVLLKTSCIRIQQQYKANVLAKRQQQEFVRLKQAVLCIQRRFRALNIMKNERKKYINLQNSCKVIQRRFRANKIMEYQQNYYKKLKLSVIAIQRRYRGKLQMRLQMKQYRNIRDNIIIIQRRLQATLIMRKDRIGYLNMKKATVCIQHQFRAQIKMQNERKAFRDLKCAAILIQRRFRANQLSKKFRYQYQIIRKYTIAIQRRFRAQQMMKGQLKQFQEMKNAAVCIQQRFRANSLMKIHSKNYQKLKTSAILIQQIYRGHILRKQEREKYLTLKKAATIIQTHWMAMLSMRKDRKKYLEIRQSSIVIQRWFLSIQQRKIQQEKYQTWRQSAVLIQRKFRAYLQMKTVLTKYCQMRTAAIIIQRRFRAQYLMQTERNSFLLLRKNVISIQTKFKAKLSMRIVRNQYHLIRYLCICIQQKFRAKLAMKRDRQLFLLQRNAAITIQRRYRAKKSMEIERKIFLTLTRITIGMQAKCRGIIARRNFQAMLTPEMIEVRRRLNAVRKIQCYWRGYLVRRKKNNKIKNIRNKIQILKRNQDPQQLISNRLVNLVKILKVRHSSTDVLNALTRLVKISRDCPQTLMQYSKFVANLCYGFISQAIRSEVDKLIIEHCSYIMLNLARYEPTCIITFKQYDWFLISQILMRWCDKHCAIFDTLCTLIWIFSHDYEKKKNIREFMFTQQAQFLVQEMKKLVLRKENMRRNRIQPLLQPITINQRRQLPMLKPDFGIPRDGNVYIFNCSVFAFETMLSKLEIDI